MSAMRALRRLVSFLRPDRAERELSREIDAHLALIEEDLRRGGVPAEDARAEARRRLGGIEQAKDLHRDARSFIWLEDLRRDVRLAFRTLRRDLAFTAVAVFTLAVGIGANTAIFSVVSNVLLEPLPYVEADRLVRLMVNVPAERSPTKAPLRTNVGLTAADVAELSARLTRLDAIGTAGPELVGLSGREEGARLQGARMSVAVFEMLGARPLIGRTFVPFDQLESSDQTIIISETVWQRYFGRDPAIVGRSLTLDSVLGPRRQARYTVVGVMPRGFEFPRPATEFWMPLRIASSGPTPRGPMIGRLADGVSLEAAAAEIAPIISEMRKAQFGAGARYELVREQSEIVAPVRPALLVLTAAVGCVLLIALVNVANLLLARTSTRDREIAIRTALGAGRGRVVRYLLTESVTLSVIGGALGVLLAIVGVVGLRRLGTTLQRFDLGVTLNLPRLHEVAIDGWVLAFTTAVALVSGVSFGIVPALRQSRANPVDALKDGAASSSGGERGGMRNALVVAEIGLAIMLLVSGTLLAGSFVRLLSVDAGYQPANVLTFQVSVPLQSYPDARLLSFAEDLVDRLRAVPGIQDAAYGNQVPMIGIRDTFGGLFRTADSTRTPPPRGQDARLVSRGYLKAMGIEVVSGRGFTDDDRAGRPGVILVNETLAKTEFPGESPIGQLMFIGRRPAPWQIVGIVRDVRQFGLDREPEAQFFLDARQWPEGAPLFPTGAYYVVRTDRSVAAALAEIRNAVRTLEPDAALFNVAPMEHIVSATIAAPRLYAVLMSAFAAIGLVLAVVGIYGVMTYTVTQRTREIGIRMSLGARRSSVLALVLGRTVAITAAGVVLGIGGAAATTRYLEGMLFGVTPLDTVTILGVAVAFAAVALIAAAIPASRATRIDPLVALKYE
jgi:predicted permease